MSSDSIRRLAKFIGEKAAQSQASSAVVASQEAQRGTDAALAGHLAATDPHPQYITPAKGDVRYALAPALTDPTTTTGDLLYRGPVSLTRLPLGAAGQFLGIAGGVPTWAAVAWADVAGKPATFPPAAHTQAASTISDLQEAVEDIVGAAVKAGGTNVTIAYNDATGETTISVSLQSHASSHASGGSDPVTPAAIGALALAGGTMTGPITLDDGASLDNRVSDMWVVPTDHFTAFSGWNWAGAPFAGAPATATTASLASLLAISDSVLSDRFFTFKATASTSDVYARVAAGAGPRIGIRIDDGTDNNYIEVYVEDSATTGFKRIARAIRAGGGAVATLTIADNLPNMWLIIRAQKTASQIFSYYGVDTPVVALLGSGVAASWTPTRAGIIYIQNVAGRSAVVDWIRL